MAYSINKEDVIRYQPDALRRFSLCTYEYIDNLHFTFKPEDFLPNAADYVEVAHALFRNAGWNGDGEIQLIWIPPFMLSDFAAAEAAAGTVVWHVKQTDDGISWLLSPDRLPFDR